MEARQVIEKLRAKGWTLAAIADSVGVNWDTVRRWEKGAGKPANPMVMDAALESLLDQEPPPRRRRHQSG